jgi:hypothetical protein
MSHEWLGRGWKTFLHRSSVALVEQGNSLDPRSLSRICVYWGFEEKEER